MNSLEAQRLEKGEHIHVDKKHDYPKLIELLDTYKDVARNIKSRNKDGSNFDEEYSNYILDEIECIEQGLKNRDKYSVLIGLRALSKIGGLIYKGIIGDPGKYTPTGRFDNLAKFMLGDRKRLEEYISKISSDPNFS